MTALLLALMASAPPTFFLPPGLPREVQRQLLDDIYSDTTVDPVLLEFMPASGTGAVPGVGDMCNWMQLGGYLSGSYTCLQGDGSVYASPGMGLTEVGSPEHDEWATCSNGPDCTPRSGARTDGSGTQRWVTPTQATFTGDFWGCWGGVVDPRASTQYMLAKYTGSAADQSFTFNAGATAYSLTLGTNPGLATVASVSSGWTPGALQVACFTFDRDASGTHTVRLYLDGSKGATATTTTTPLPATGASYAVSAGSLGAAALSGRVMFAAVGDGLPSDADMVRMANAFLGTLAGTKGEALALTRNTVSTCCRDDGTGCVVLPPGRACVANGRLKVRPVVANLLAQSDALDTTPWGDASGGVVSPVTTANVGLARSGTMSAERIDFPAVPSATNHSSRSQSVIMTAATHTFAVDVQGVSGSGRVYLYATPDAVTYISAPCDFTSSAPVRCTATGTTTASSWNWRIGVDLRDATQAAQPAQSIYVSAAQLTATASPLDYCPTGAAPASCAAEGWSFQEPPGLVAERGCAKACITPAFTGAVPGSGGQDFVRSLPAGSARLLYTNGGTTAIFANNGAQGPGVTANYTAGQERCYLTEWGLPADAARVTNLAEPANTITAGAFGGFPAITTNTTVGTNGTQFAWALSSLKIGNAPGACTP